MSRTDKDAPYWVRSEWYQPDHTCVLHHGRGWQRTAHECDLPPKPVMQHPKPWRERKSRCVWIPAWEPDIYRRPNPRRWFVDHVWTSRMRTRVRDELRLAAAQYRATADVFVDPDISQHRHCARWLWD